jgi:MOSC domain-containing protein YiiM
MSEGRVDGIFIGPETAGLLHEVPEVVATAGKGLEGDRKHRDHQREEVRDEPGRELTLIEAESLERLAEETGIVLGPGESRRQITTRGVRLLELVGKRFYVGEVECIGIEDNPSCAHLQSLTQPGVLRGLARSGGIRADILSSGTIRTGDAIREVPDRAPAEAT